MSVASSQVVFADLAEGPHRSGKKHPTPLLIENSLLLLPLLVVVSLGILLLSWLVPKIYRFIARHTFRRNYQPLSTEDEDDDLEEPEPTPTYMPSRGLLSDFRAHIRSFKEAGTVLFALEVIRTLCLCALLALSIYATIQAESPRTEHGMEAFKRKKHKGKKHKGHHHTVDEYSSLEWGEFGASAFYTYTLLCSFLLLTLRPATPLRLHIIAHLDILLFLGWCLYAYRDFWPLVTTYLVPVDLQNAVTWSRLAILSVAAILLPLIRPRTYVPVDPLNPTPKDQIHPEQTSPWLFYVFYEFMTPIIWKAWRTPALPYDELPPLADYDKADILYLRNVKRLDPYRRAQQGLGRRHIFWLLGYVFRKEFVITCLMCFISGAAELAAPVGTQQILLYLQNHGENQSYHPLLWVALLFFGPLIGSLSIQYYIFVMTRCLVRSESILTQLLFDHALRLRMKDSVGEEEKKEVPAEGTKTPLIRIEPAEGGGPEGAMEHVDAAHSETGRLNGSDTTEVGSSGSKGKAADKDETKKEQAVPPGQGLAGKINVLMAADVESVVEGRDLPLVLVYMPIQLVLCIVFLYRILSWSALVGMFVMIITLPLPGILTKFNATYQSKRMVATDARVDVITEAVGALRMLKMFAWEGRMKERIAAKREVELDLIWKRRLMSLSTTLLNIILPVFTMSITYAVYTLVEKKELTAATVFSSMSVFELVKGQMGMCFYLINGFVTAWVSLGRIDDFLHQSEMVDEFTPAPTPLTHTQEQLEAEEQGLIKFKDATFNWGSKGSETPGFALHLDDVTFVKGKINLITGPTGCGKSSVLKALIGELHFLPQSGSLFHLPRDGGVSYAAQESWCLSETIKDNIVFGEPFEMDRYRAVVRDCGLEPDLKLLDDGDQTEIGEKGVTLSGGQKARVTLARAVYSKTAIVLLDDIFSALDTLTSRFIIDNLFKGDLMRDRTVLLIVSRHLDCADQTHHIGLVAPMADYMLALNENGTVRSAGPIDDVLEKEDLAEEVKEEKEGTPDETAKPEEKKSASKLTQAEEKAEGRISRQAMFSFFGTFGGPIFWILYFGLVLSGQGFMALETYWLGVWATAYEKARVPGEVSVPYYLGIYFVWVMSGLITAAAASILFYLGAIKASRNIHKRLVDYIFGAYARFLDTTPVGRIVSRFTKDMKSIDGSFTETFSGVAEITIGMAIKLLVVVSLVPLFSIPSVIIGAVGGFLGEVYIHGQLSVKREMSNSKSPLFSHFSAAVNGIVSIRAFGAQDKLRAEARRRADKYTRAATAFYNLNRWVTVRIDMLGGLFAALLAAFLVYGPRMSASTAGFALNQAIAFSYTILWWVRMVNQMEVEGNSVERIQDYLVIDQEPKYAAEKQPPASWPTSGEIVLDKLCARYSKDGPIVLDNLEVTIKSGEKVGIVGRTGSGKSTLALAILRMVPTTGSVMIDGVKTENINLEALRSNVTIIPQDPILLSGSMRFNLDPFGDHDDAELNDALQSSGLGATRHAESGTATPQRLTLDSPIAAGGGNLSQGQRQLVALARALVRGSKVLILDEATASVDFETDSLIQQSIRNLPQNTTVLTVAHRLATVMDYDKILVLGAGKVLEYDAPGVLKDKKDSYFAKLVQAMEG